MAALSGVGYQSQEISAYTQKSLKDATFIARKVKANQRELVKINKDFGTSYRFDRIKFNYREPLQLRLEASVDETTALYVINGWMQMARVPRLGIRAKDDLKDNPGRRQTPLDFGVLVPSLFTELFKAKFVRLDRATGNAVFDLNYQYKDDTSRHRIWVDVEKGITTKREWYNQPGRQLATFFYEKPMKVNGVWIPTQLTVRNVDNQVAGVTSYETIKVNTGLSADLFKIE